MARNRTRQKSKVTRAGRAVYWKSVSGASLAVFYTGVFGLFSCLGFITLLMQPVQLRPRQVLLVVLASGGFAVIYAALAIARKFIYMPGLMVLQGGVFTLVAWTYSDAKPLVDAHSPLPAQAILLGFGAVVSLVLGYVLFLVFFSREGTRYFRAHAEVALAAEIHRALVPPVHKTIGHFEIYGASIPSGQVGGDVVDVAEDGDRWIGYVADVSGHGVSSGVLMAMFKTAVRSRAAARTSAGMLLEDVHRTLYPLKTANMYVTAGFIECREDREFSVSLAGHPPLLHYHASSGTVSEVAARNLPVGVFPVESFATDSLPHASGDVLVLFTDGLSEVFDSHGDELGIEPLKSALRGQARNPLPQLFDRLRQVALSFGPQDDDQTMLLVRCLDLD
jgi:hypothetical protein